LVDLKKGFFFVQFLRLFLTVKIKFSSNFLHGTPQSNANFSLREFQANRSVTAKVLSLLAQLRILDSIPILPFVLRTWK